MTTKTKQTVCCIVPLAFLLPLLRGAYVQPLFGATADGAGFGGVVSFGLYGVTLVVAALVLVAGEKGVARFLERRTAIAALTVIGLAGFLLCFLRDGAAVFGGAALLAVFLAGSLALWAEVLAGFSPARMIACASVGFVASFFTHLIAQLPSPVPDVQMLLVPLVSGSARLWCGEVPRRSDRSFLDASKELPLGFALSMALFCLVGNLFGGITGAFQTSVVSDSVFYMTAANLSIGLIIIVLVVFHVRTQKLLFWYWFVFSLGFLVGVFLSAFPDGTLLKVGSDIVTLSRVGIEFLLFLCVILIIAKTGTYSPGMLGALFILPVGLSVLLRGVVAPLVAHAVGEQLLGSFPIIVLGAGFALLFAQYAFVGKTYFEGFFESREAAGDGDCEQDALDSLHRAYGLTERETTVASYIAKGYSLNKIADLLSLSPNTIRSHYRSIYRKCAVHKRQELIEFVETLKGRSLL